MAEPVPIEPLNEQAEVAEENPPAETKAKKTSAPRKRNPPTHPPYFEMIKEAIVRLKKGKAGSSQHAITKFIEKKHNNLPSIFRTMLLLQLKRLVSSGKLIKVKASYKLPEAAAKQTKPKKAAAKETKPKTKPKPKAAPKAKTVDSTASPKANTADSTASPSTALALAAAESLALVLAAAANRKAKAKAAKEKPAKVAKTPTRSTPSRKVKREKCWTV